MYFLPHKFSNILFLVIPNIIFLYLVIKTLFKGPKIYDSNFKILIRVFINPIIFVLTHTIYIKFWGYDPSNYVWIMLLYILSFLYSFLYLQCYIEKYDEIKNWNWSKFMGIKGYIKTKSNKHSMFYICYWIYFFLQINNC